MKLVIPLFHLEETLGPEWRQPVGLLTVADATLLEQMMASARKWLDFTPVLGVTAAGTSLADWWNDRFPDIVAETVIGPQADPSHFIQRISAGCSADSVVLIAGDAIIDANLGGLDQAGTDVICLVRAARVGDRRLVIHDSRLIAVDDPGGHWAAAGLWWFRRGELLSRAFERTPAKHPPELFGADLARRLLDLEIPITARETDLVEPIDTTIAAKEMLLSLNHRLLGFGRSSDDAIERSYGEDFTVLTPVYIDETAIIDSAVIGPYATIAAGAEVRNSVVRNSIIGPGAIVDGLFLEGAIIGQGAIVRGRGRSLLIAEEAEPASEAA